MLGFIGNIQTLQFLIQNRGVVTTVFHALALSQWAGLAVFGVGVTTLGLIHRRHKANVTREPSTPPVITYPRRNPMDRWLRQVDQFNADQREKAAEAKRRKAKRDELLDKVGELIRERKTRHPSEFAIRQNIFGLLIAAGAHRLDSEEDLVEVCDEIVAAGHEHPFTMFGREDSPVKKGEWLEFVRAFHVSGMPSEDTGGWTFATTRWRGKDRWLNRYHPAMRELHGSEFVTHKRDANSSYEMLWGLINQGDAMRRRIREGKEPLPAESDVARWAESLIAVAQACASVSEVQQLKNSANAIRVGDMIDDELSAPKETWDMLEELYGKAKVARAIAARIHREDKA